MLEREVTAFIFSLIAETTELRITEVKFVPEKW